MRLILDRPLAIFDIESTGVNRKVDRIVDLAIVTLFPDGSRKTVTFLLNPEMPIPAEVTAIHGITDEDVKDAPTFKEKATEIRAVLEGCDFAGYNLIYFDIPLLEEEFKRAEVDFSMDGRQVIDAQRIYHKKEPRDLTAALKYYCGAEHENAHGALPDVEATILVLEGQLDMYEDLPDKVKALDLFCSYTKPHWVDKQGKLRWDADGEAAINFGKNQGKKLRILAQMDQSFMKWILKGDFPNDMQDVVREALEGRFPEKP